MAEEQAKLVITAENRTDAAFRQIQASMGNMSKAANDLQSIFKNIAFGYGIQQFVSEIGRATMAAEQSVARLNATLRATGNQPGASLERMVALQKELSSTTFFNEEDIRNAEAMLVRFGDIHGEVFARALRLSADLAAFLGTDIPSAANMIGKAMTAPTEGLAALSRVLGKLDPAIRENIRNLEEHGTKAEAQAAILAALEGQMGRTAEAMNTGLKKATSDLAKEWDKLAQSLGNTRIGKDAPGAIAAITGKMKELEELMSRGTWAEKVLKIIAWRSGFAGIPLSAGGPVEGPTVTGRVTGTPPTLAQVAQGGMTDEDWTDAMKAKFDANLKKQDEAAAKAKKAADAYQLAQDEQAAMKYKWAQANEDLFNSEARLAEQLEGLEKSRAKQAEDIAKIKEMADPLEPLRKKLEEIDKAFEDGAISLEEWAAAYGKVSRDMVKVTEQNADAVEKTSNVARQLGFTFTSAFEDAIIEGKNFRDILAGIGEDIARLILRTQVEEPFIKWAFGAAASGGGGGALDAMFASIFGAQHGADFYVGGAGAADSRLVAFRATPGERVTVTPPGGASGGLTVVVQQTNYVDARSDIGSIRSMLDLAKSETKREIEASLQRGGPFAAAVGRVRA